MKKQGNTKTNDILKIIPWITFADKHATIGQIIDRLKSKYSIKATPDDVQKAIETITGFSNVGSE